MTDQDQMDVDYGGVMRRLGAMILDMIIVLAIFFGLAVALGAGSLMGAFSSIAGGMGDMAGGGALGMQSEAQMASSLDSGGTVLGMKLVWTVAIIQVVMILYYLVLPATPLRGTLGKKILGLAIVDKHQNRIGLGRSLWRYIVWCFSIGFIVGGLVAFFNKQRKGLHDMAAGTLVVRTESCPDQTASPSMVGKLANGLVGLLCIVALGGPIYGYVTGAGSDMMGMASMSGMDSASGPDLTGLMKETSRKATSKTKAPGLAVKKPVKKKKASGGPRIDLRPANIVAGRFEDMAVKNQAFPTSVVDLHMSEAEFSQHQISNVMFDSAGAMVVVFEKGADRSRLTMKPVLDDSTGYIKWQCSGVPLTHQPKVCRLQ